MDDVSIRDYADTIVIHCTNGFLQLDAIQFMDTCRKLIPQKAIKSIIFDFSDITSCEILSAGNLLQAVSHFTGLNIRTYLYQIPESCLCILRKTELVDFFAILESEEDMLLLLPD